MFLNQLSPAEGSKKTSKRLGRGIGSGKGKTCGKGHKGQKARAGGNIGHAFEGGQTPLQRRLPKFGFTSRKAKYYAEVPTRRLENLGVDKIDMLVLKELKVISNQAKQVKIVLNGELTKAITVRGVGVTKGAKALIEKCGGKVEE